MAGWSPGQSTNAVSCAARDALSSDHAGGRIIDPYTCRENKAPTERVVTLTRSVSEETRDLPRLRFGLVSVHTRQRSLSHDHGEFASEAAR